MQNLLSSLKQKLGGKRRRWLIVAALVVLSGGLYFYYAEVPPVLAQSTTGSLHNVAAAASGQRVLVFSPHPDDETVGVGGYIAQSIRDGADVRIVLVTDGNYHHNQAVRYAEFKKATSILGVPQGNLVFLNFPDSKLREQDEGTIYQAFKQQIDLYNPDIVIYPYPRDYNPDHSTTGRIVEEILKAEPRKITAYEYLVHYEVLYPRPRGLYTGLYITPPKRLVTADRDWQQFLLSQDIEDLKAQAALTYQSQLHDPWLRGLLLSFIRKNELLVIPN